MTKTWLALVVTVFAGVCRPAFAGTITKAKSDGSRILADLTDEELEGLKVGASLNLRFADQTELVAVKLVKLDAKKRQALFLVSNPPDFLEAELEFTTEAPKAKVAAKNGASPNAQTWSTSSGVASLYASSSHRSDLAVTGTSTVQAIDGEKETTRPVVETFHQAFSFGRRQGGIGLEVSSSAKPSEYGAAIDVAKSVADLAIIGLSASYLLKNTVPALTLGAYQRSTLGLVSFSPKTTTERSKAGGVFEMRASESIYLSGEGAFNFDDLPHPLRGPLTFGEKLSFRAGGSYILGASSCVDAGVIRNTSSFAGRLSLRAPTPTLGGYAGYTMRFGAWDVRLAAEGAYGAASHTYTPEDKSTVPVSTITTNRVVDVQLRAGVRY